MNAQPCGCGFFRGFDRSHIRLLGSLPLFSCQGATHSEAQKALGAERTVSGPARWLSNLGSRSRPADGGPS
jgi:hypothetical protein